MTNQNYANILIAEDNEVNRNMMAGLLRNRGYTIHEAIDGDSAIEVMNAQDIDMALVDINMAPKGGFEFIRYLLVEGIDIPVVVITGDESSDVLAQANTLGVKRLIQKPVDPDLLFRVVERILKQLGINPAPLAVGGHDSKLSPEALMNRAIDMAGRNVDSGKGGPFAAVVADKDGRIIAEGVSGLSGRADPIAHAEVAAIRSAADKLGRTDLSDCLLYCVSEPTRVGAALITSVGIAEVYYALSHKDVEAVASKGTPAEPSYKQMAGAGAQDILKRWQFRK